MIIIRKAQQLDAQKRTAPQIKWLFRFLFRQQFGLLITLRCRSCGQINHLDLEFRRILNDLVRFIADRKVDVEQLFTRRWRLEQAEEAC